MDKTEILPMWDDPRPIDEVSCVDMQGHWRVGWKAGRYEGPIITSIVAYKEKGPMDFVPFVAVLCDGEIHTRIPAWQVVVTYKIGDSDG